MRTPFQVLVIPFRRTTTGPRFAVLRRSDAGCWQFVAGGGEDGESPLQAAQRETQEELGVNGRVFPLDTTTSIPKSNFLEAEAWGKEILVVPEYCFYVEIGDSVITLSAEHTDLSWLPYKQAYSLLHWDSNRTALWELHERLEQGGREDGCCVSIDHG